MLSLKPNKTSSMENIRGFRNEKWKLFEHEDYDVDRYEIKVSNYGRLVKRKTKEEKFKLVKPTNVNNFLTFRFPSKTKLNKYGKKRDRGVYIHKIVAQLFMKEIEGKKFVIHLDHDLQNNRVQNLKYVNQKELTIHQLSNPKRIIADKNKQPSNCKLTETKVKLLKRKLNNPNRRTRLKIIAKQFGVSQMQLRRIKTGENWGYVTEY